MVKTATRPEPAPMLLDNEEAPKLARSGLKLSTLMIALGGFAVLFAIARYSWPLAAGLSISAFGVITVSGFLMRARGFRGERDGLIKLLAAAANAGVPLGPGISAYGELCSPRFRERLARLVARLDAGDSLPDALDRIPGLVDRTDLLLVRAGAGDGGLAEVLTGIVEDRARLRLLGGGVALRIAYFFMLLFVLQGITFFLTHDIEFAGRKFGNIQGKLLAITSDFKINPPPALRGMLALQMVLDWTALGWVVFAVELAFFALFLLRLLGFWRDGAPLVDRFFTRRETLRILRIIGITAGAQRPITDALALLARHHPKKWVRKRLARARDRALEGATWTEALYESALIGRNDRVLLESAQEADNLVWAITELVNRGERRRLEALDLASRVASLGALVLLGLAVLWFALAYFTPLISLLESVVSQI